MFLIQKLFKKNEVPLPTIKIVLYGTKLSNLNTIMAHAHYNFAPDDFGKFFHPVKFQLIIVITDLEKYRLLLIENVITKTKSSIQFLNKHHSFFEKCFPSSYAMDLVC